METAEKTNPELLAGAEMIVCQKNCQSLDRFGNDLCQRRTLEDREKISIHYVGHTPPPAPADRFITGISHRDILVVNERISSSVYKHYLYTDADGTTLGTLLVTEEEMAKMPLCVVEDGTDFICPKRRRWANESDIQRGVIINKEGTTFLIDKYGEVLTAKGEEIPLKINVPIPGQVGSEGITYLPTMFVNGINGKTFFCRDWDAIKKTTEKDIIKHLFRPSPVVKVDIEELEILILQKPVDSSDWGHQSDIAVHRKGDDVAKYTPGVNRHLLKPGDSVTLPESHEGGFNQWYTLKTIFRNKDGKLDKCCPAKKKFASEQIKLACEIHGVGNETLWKITRACGPGALLQALSYSMEIKKAIECSPNSLSLDIALVVLNQAGPGKTQLGRDRAEAVLRMIGLPIPSCRNSANFFKILLGARKAIHLCLIKKENVH